MLVRTRIDGPGTIIQLLDLSFLTLSPPPLLQLTPWRGIQITFSTLSYPPVSGLGPSVSVAHTFPPVAVYPNHGVTKTKVEGGGPIKREAKNIQQ
jgi:hypothetical protein